MIGHIISPEKRQDATRPPRTPPEKQRGSIDPDLELIWRTLAPLACLAFLRESM